MSQQGGRPTGHEDDWWGQLYDDSTDDTGPTTAPDSLDDRFASAAGAVEGPPDAAAGPLDERPPADPSPWWTPTEAGTSGPRAGGTAVAPGAGGGGAGVAPGVPGAGGGGAAAGPGAPGAGSGGAEVAPGAGGGGAAADSGVHAARTGGAPVEPGVPGPRDAGRTGSSPPRGGGTGTPAIHAGPPLPRAPWEPPPGTPTGPVTFPPGPRHPGAAEPPRDSGARGTGPRTPAERRIPDETPPSPPPWPPPPPLPPQPPASSARKATGGPPSAADMPLPPGFGDTPVTPMAPAAGPDTSGSPAPPVGAPLDAGSAPAPTSTPRISDVPPDPPATETPRDYVGSGPPTYDSEPTALPAADPDGLDDLVADTVLDGARYGSCTLRAVSVRGDSARYRGDPRRDALLTARFGAGEQALILVAMATGARGTPGAHRAAAEVCEWIGRAVGRSQARLVEDLRAARRGDLKSGLHRLTDRSLGRLRADAVEQGLDPDEHTATLRCLLLPADPRCRTRVFFGVGAGGLLRLRDGAWQDIEPRAGDVAGEPVVGFGSAPSETPEGDRLTMDLGITTPPSPYEEPAAGPPRRPFRFRASVARPGDVLLMCTAGLAEPLAGEPELGELLARRWSGPTPPGLAAFLADSRVRVKGYADDRTAAAVWEA
ncbi:hypothetical protein GCM10010377_07940 [Streptomyces viridiviolaceus]|uniref:Protein phosphatase 2C domain-containing protein n=1 Tax=Streptomyces viridiviolaceus TaxID=68282 RepID=A0ABW2DVK8_9ACTN|nr:hypothetical protein GCM10010377_07940 [Streptomyces viridiviolaceus]